MLTSTFSVTQWWIAAIVSGIALAVAAQFMATTRTDRLKVASLPLVGAAAMALISMARGYEGRTPLMLYTATMMGLVATRIIFAGYIRRQVERVRSGKQMEKLTTKQVVVYFLTFAAVVLAMAAIL